MTQKNKNLLETKISNNKHKSNQSNKYLDSLLSAMILLILLTMDKRETQVKRSENKEIDFSAHGLTPGGEYRHIFCTKKRRNSLLRIALIEFRDLKNLLKIAIKNWLQQPLTLLSTKVI